MIARCNYLKELVVPFRIDYVNLGEKVLKYNRGRTVAILPYENIVIHGDSKRQQALAVLHSNCIFRWDRSVLLVSDELMSECGRFSISGSIPGEKNEDKDAEEWSCLGILHEAGLPQPAGNPQV